MLRLSCVLSVAFIGLALTPIKSTAAPVTASQLEDFLGLQEFALDAFGNGEAFEGSAIRRTFTAAVGDVISFDFQFLTTEDPTPDLDVINDFAVVSISPLMAVGLTEVLSANTSVGPVASSGPRNFTAQLLSAGTFTLGIGIADVVDGDGDSSLLIDNLRLNDSLLPNGGFESGFTNSTTVGSADIRGAVLGISPTEGGFQVELSTGNQMIPEPSTIALLSVAVFGGIFVTKRRRATV